ncbi:hypothetical protein ILYODFUR_019500 [Ilyodon furcidens]|uniref:Transmembrane protein n=1 Tax=Ilyodon furcidens TaxID=33524 RepID=A0ABV0V620_9TELE
MGPLCRAGSTLSLFFSVRSFSLPVNLCLLVNYFSISCLKLFPAVSIQFTLISSCLVPCLSSQSFCAFLQHLFFSSSALLSFSSLCLPLFASVCSFFYLFSLPLQDNVGEERTDLFKISKDRSGGPTGSPSSFHEFSLPSSDR